MDTSSFESEFNKFFKKVDTPIKKFIQEKYIQSKKKNYYTFIEGFLLSYGIYAYSSFPCQFNKKFLPFVNCQENNIFGLKAGITDITNKPLSLEESEIEIARFLIKKFNKIPLSEFQNWSSENS